MYCNTGVTLYHDTGAGYTTTYFSRAFWQATRNAVTGKNGETVTDGVKLIIPTVKEIAVTEDDFFVKGKGAPVNNASEQTIVNSIKALGKVHSVASVSPKLYGSAAMRHYEFLLR